MYEIKKWHELPVSKKPPGRRYKKRIVALLRLNTWLYPSDEKFLKSLLARINRNNRLTPKQKRRPV